MGISLKKALNRLFKSENGNTLMDARWNKKMKTTRQVLMQIKKIIEIIMRNSAFTQPVQAGVKTGAEAPWCLDTHFLPPA